MTPEQTRNYWILEGYPLMPEWIVFCREYSEGMGASLMFKIQKWWALASVTHNVSPEQGAYFDFIDGQLAFVITNSITYHWNLGEDHAEQ